MSSLQLAGLSSGFDWKSFVDQMISLERSSGAKMEAEIASNQLKLTALTGVESRVKDLRAAVSELGSGTLFGSRTATTSASGWSASVGTSAASGSYTFNVTQRATASRWTGGADIGSPLAATNDVSGVTLASLGTAITPTAGVFTVNGSRVTVALGDSLQEVFTKISTATGGAVAAAYDSATDRVTLSGSGPVVLGSTTDTSNLLSALRLGNNGTNTVSSATALGSASAGATLANARLATAVTAVDGAGNGSFTVNGVAINYNVNTDSLNAILARINASGAGVTASFDPFSDRVSLVNNKTGDLGVSLEESPGGLLSALRLTSGSGAALTRGLNAQFSVNGGATLSSASNTLDESSHGIAGLSVTTDAASASSTVTVASDTTTMRSRVNAFVSAFNSLQEYIDSQTRVTSSNGKVTTSTLSSNREIQNWGTQLRSAVFASVPGLESAISRLDNLGIDFTGTSATLAIKDSAKLDAALRDRPAQVAAFFQQASTGFVARMETLFGSYVGPLGTSGLLGGQRTAITNSNASLTKQISDLDRRLEQRRAQLEAGFIAMERAQSTIQQMQSQLSNAFPNTSSSKK